MAELKEIIDEEIPQQIEGSAFDGVLSYSWHLNRGEISISFPEGGGIDFSCPVHGTASAHNLWALTFGKVKLAGVIRGHVNQSVDIGSSLEFDPKINLDLKEARLKVRVGIIKVKSISVRGAIEKQFDKRKAEWIRAIIDRVSKKGS